MAAVIKILPYDPGISKDSNNSNKRNSDNKRHYHIPIFDSWFFLSIRHHSANSQTKNYSEKEQGLSSKAVAAFYLFLQVFVAVCVECVKRTIATTVHRIHLIRSIDLLEKLPAPSETESLKSFEEEKSIKSNDHQVIKKGVKKQEIVTKDLKEDKKLASDRRQLFSDQQLTEFSKKTGHLFDFYYFREIPWLKPCRESSIATVIFEVRSGGLTHLAKDVSIELRNRYEFKQSNGVSKSDEILACCEIQWSVPMKYRSAYWPEMMIKNEADQMMRVNNQLIYDKLFSDVLGLKRASRGGKVEEETCTTEQCYLGVRRHFYPELLDLIHAETKAQHQPFWQFDADKMALNVNWPVCGDFESTTTVVVNYISLKF